MGKVKGLIIGTIMKNFSYQFPMGKVKKKNAKVTILLNMWVSIPNGKGKEQYLVLCFNYTYYI